MSLGHTKTESRRPADRILGWTTSVVCTPGRGTKPRHFRLSDPTIRIERNATGHPSAIVLEDPAVSQDGVTLRQVDGGHYELEDTGSRNPVRVNGQSVHRARINANDVVRIGDSLLVFDRDDPARSARRRKSLREQRVDQLMTRLCMFGSTASHLARLDASMIEPDYRCIAVWTPGALESRITADWLAESWGEELVIIEGIHEQAAERIRNAPQDAAVLVDRIDFASPAAMLDLGNAIEARIHSPEQNLTIMTIDGALHKDRPAMIEQVVSLVADFELFTPRVEARKVDVLRAIVSLMGESLDPAPELSVDLCEHLLCYPWPGELAELRRTARWLESAVRRDDPLDAGILPSSMRSVQVDPDEPTAQSVTREAILNAFHEHAGNMSAIAEHFGYSRTYFYKLMKSEHIDIQQLRADWERTRRRRSR